MIKHQMININVLNGHGFSNAKKLINFLPQLFSKSLLINFLHNFFPKSWLVVWLTFCTTFCTTFFQKVGWLVD
jgi:hypothetical protein